jgi:hypothetical protein
MNLVILGAMLKNYDRSNAVSYAHQWAYARNPRYYNYDLLGGDCTNFVSQCIYSGSKIMNPSKTLGWYYYDTNHKSPSWTGVDFLFAFMVQNRGPGPFCMLVEAKEILEGDFIQLSRQKHGSFQHSCLVVQKGYREDPYGLLVAAHSADSDYRPLSTYQWERIRFVHILGFRI